MRDLNKFPYPFEDNLFDEVHAYEVLEHLGHQGDYEAFFAQFSEFWRILKPNGVFVASVPSMHSDWVWGDPGHTRLITQGTIVFLSQKQYAAQVGITPATDYRNIYKGDFEAIELKDDGETFWFVLKAVKEAK